MGANDFQSKVLSIPANIPILQAVIGPFLLNAGANAIDIIDVKAAVGEALTNAALFAYPDTPGFIRFKMHVDGDMNLTVTVSDTGVGIKDLDWALEPFTSTGDPEKMAGLGFSIMESFMDSVRVTSRVDKGTRVIMKRKLGLDANERAWSK